ncbi:MAG: TIGR00282 family metallophosphoesterase [Planctomycetota bacterium]
MSDSLRILCLGDVVGKPGVQGIRRQLPAWRRELGADFVICNAENAVDGSGLIPSTAKHLVHAGCDVLTSGDHIYKRPEAQSCLAKPEVLRPANFPDGGPGRGWDAYDCDGHRIGVINLMGQVFMRPCDNPFRLVESAMADLSDCELVVVDMHAEATSEKAAMAHFLDGRVSAVFGTHTHVATADEQILAGGTGFITDIGMCGPHDSILGRRTDAVVTAMSTWQQRPFTVAKADVRLNGVLFTCAGRACTHVERVRLHCPPPAAHG